MPNHNPIPDTDARVKLAFGISHLLGVDVQFVLEALQPAEAPPVGVRFVQLHAKASQPQLATSGSACFDLCSVDFGVMYPGSRHLFRTGIAMEIPDGYCLLIFSRSGQGTKGVRLANCVGVIDSDYRGEVQVSLSNDGEEEFRVNPGDRIAQAMLVPTIPTEFVETDALSETERGSGGFGSTGTSSIAENAEDKPISDRRWAALPASRREGCTVHVDGVGDL